MLRTHGGDQEKLKHKAGGDDDEVLSLIEDIRAKVATDAMRRASAENLRILKFSGLGSRVKVIVGNRKRFEKLKNFVVHAIAVRVNSILGI